MMLKNIFGKTMDAAKKSAQQMYGDDVALFDKSSDKQSSGNPTSDESSAQTGGRNDRKKEEDSVSIASREGVKFEFSGNDPRKKSDRLNSLRKHALEMSEEKEEQPSFKASMQEAEGKNETETVSPEAKSPMTISGATYSRSAVRKPVINNIPETQEASPSPSAEPEGSIESKEEAPVQGKFITHFKARKQASARRFQTAAAVPETSAALPDTQSQRKEERDIKIFHKRFDKLEGMMNASLITSGLNYVSHPAFQQLVETGMSPAVVSDWFRHIVHEGIDPYEQESRFMQELAGMIRRCLGDTAESDLQKFMLFTGPTGCGKSSLIMKLCRSESRFNEKKIAVAEVLPTGAEAGDHFSALLPFCEKYRIPYFSIRTGVEAGQLMEQVRDYDHVLIDTPSLSINKEHAFREFWKLRQMLMSFAPMEIHYVVKASMSRYYFRNISDTNQHVQPDHVAITHVDEVSEFGPLISFLKDMQCGCRYVSIGKGLTDSLGEYDPRALARRILEHRG